MLAHPRRSALQREVHKPRYSRSQDTSNGMSSFDMLSSILFQDLNPFLCGNDDAYHHQYVTTYLRFGDCGNKQEGGAEEKASWSFGCDTQQTAVNDGLKYSIEPEEARILS